MSVNEVVARKDYTGNGSVDAFAYTWRITDKTHLEVLVDGVVQTVDTDYTVSGVDAAAGGSVTFTTAPADQTVVTLLRKQPLAQASEYVANEAFPHGRLEKDLDKVVMRLQQDAETLTRALRAPKDAVAFDGTLPAIVAGQYLRANADGDGVEFADGDLNTSTFTQSGTGAVARTVTAKLAERLDPRDFGATWNGVADDTDGLTKAIAYAKTLGKSGSTGAIIALPPGEGVISEPLVLPRTGLAPTTIVHLVGDTVHGTRLRGTADFPTNRYMIEWEATTARTWHQRIAHLTFKLPDVDGTGAIHYQPTSKVDVAAILAETLQLDLEHILIEGSNEFHPRLVYLEGNVKLSTIRGLYGDCSRGAMTYDTVVLEVDSAIAEDDASGLNYSRIEGLYGGIRRGGYHQTFKGRLAHSAWRVGFSNGSRGAPAYEFVNGQQAVVEALAAEGLSEAPQFKIEGCKVLTFRNCNPGTPNEAQSGDGVGNGIEFINSQDCTWDGHMRTPGAAAFSASSVKNLTIDANCRRLRFTNFRLSGPVADEVTNNAPAGEVEGEFYDIKNGARYFVGSPKAGVLQGWVTAASQNVSLGTLPAFTYVSNVRVQVTEGFDSDGTDLLTVGYDANPDAYVTSLDVATPGILTPTLGAEVGYVGAARAVEAYYTAGGSAPTTGKALVLLEYRPVDTEPA